VNCTALFANVNKQVRRIVCKHRRTYLGNPFLLDHDKCLVLCILRYAACMTWDVEIYHSYLLCLEYSNGGG
jgi:hypothetical protein